MASTDTPRSSSPNPGWRARLMPRRPSQEPQSPAKEVSRWSKTTTESELSETASEPASKRRNFLKRKLSQRKSPKDSPTDPFYDPISKQLQPYGADIPPIVTASRPDSMEQPRTFLDDASDDGTIDSPTSPVIQRASSVRVSKPQVIQHSNSSAASVPKLFPLQNTPSLLKNASSVSIPPQSVGEEESEKEFGPGGRNDALMALEGHAEAKDDITALPQIPAEARSERRDALRETIVSWPDTPSRLEALDTMPTPMGGFGSMRIPRSSDGTFSTNSTSTYVSPSLIMTDGLRSNPPSNSDKQLSRAISAPVRNSRRVMIRPADLIINKGGHDHKLFRENIISTPYPARKSSHVEIGGILAAPAAPQPEHKEEEVVGKKPRKLRRSRPLSHTMERSEPDDETTDITDKAPEIPLATKPTPAPAPATSKSDRFPSPSAPEILFLDLHLARHPSARVTVEIEITDKSTFDDEQLFTIIGKTYTDKLLGKARWWFCARTLEGASLNGGEGPNVPRGGQGYRMSSFDFDSADFTHHLLTPRLGRRRKHWLLWLRNSQHSAPARTPSQRGRHAHAHAHLPTHSPYDEKTSSPVFSFMHSRQNSSDASPVQEYRGVTSASTSTPKQTSVAALPRMPFNSPPSAQTPSLTSFHRSKSLALSASFPSTPAYIPPPPPVSSAPPRVYLHHTFSLRAIALATLLMAFLAIFTTVLWTLFGYPGRSAAQGDGTTTVAGKEFAVPWRRDAQARVGVGLIMGVVVVLVGGLLEVGWVWGSWVLV